MDRGPIQPRRFRFWGRRSPAGIAAMKQKLDRHRLSPRNRTHGKSSIPERQADPLAGNELNAPHAATTAEPPQDDSDGLQGMLEIYNHGKVWCDRTGWTGQGTTSVGRKQAAARAGAGRYTDDTVGFL